MNHCSDNMQTESSTKVIFLSQGFRSHPSWWRIAQIPLCHGI